MSSVLETVIELAVQAGKATLEFYHEDVEVNLKEDQSPITAADLAAHHIIADGIKKLDPDTPFISEEAEVPDYEVRQHWNKFWIIDPLDGTKEFIKRNGEYTINIALVEDRVPVLGVVYVPIRETLYYASQEGGAWKKEGDSEAVQVFSDPADKTKPLKIISSRSHGSDKLTEFLKDIQVEEHVFAGSSLKFCLVAEGKADIYPRFAPTNEWDVAAGDCVYRYSARDGAHHHDEIKYNKPSLLNDGFVIGF